MCMRKRAVGGSLECRRSVRETFASSLLRICFAAVCGLLLTPHPSHVRGASPEGMRTVWIDRVLITLLLWACPWQAPGSCIGSIPESGRTPAAYEGHGCRRITIPVLPRNIPTEQRRGEYVHQPFPRGLEFLRATHILAQAWMHSQSDYVVVLNPVLPLARLLLEDGLGYHARIHPKLGSNGASAIYALAGCLDFDEADKRCGENETEIHAL